ncbi:MAG: FAD-binding oxidoreductase [candidate division WOR-3 bacterium]|nr:FAD-binding oxidoreductase [candidate division WOR-3 bacterium]
MNKTADIIIIGAGIIGAATGYYLSKKRLKVYVFEKEYPCYGSTGRCIGGIRAQYAHPLSIQVMIESINLFSTLKEELNRDVEWYQGGYLFLAHSEEKKATYFKAIELQRKFNLPVKFISAEECAKIVPGLNTEGLLGGSYSPYDGQANPFAVTYGYLEGIKRNKGKVFTYTEIKKINLTGEKVLSVVTDKNEEYFAPIVINAAGPWAKNIGKLVGLDLPVEPERHESLVTEACERLFDPMLVDYRPDGCYFVQNYKTGHFIGCYTPIPNDPGDHIDASSVFLTEMPRRMVRLVPKLRYLKVLRQWAGSYEMTPDGNPIVGPTPIEGFYVSVGMCGHGFMFGPALGKLLAEMIIEGKSSIPLDEFSFARSFDKKELMK